jgi:hypothetical protein
VTATEIRPIHPAPSRLGQGTAIEQSRAIAQVQAMVVVAQQCPRRVHACITAMTEACQQIELAEKAFFRYPRGRETISGPSVHLARELARCWGNVEHGVTEMRRDDGYAQSEMQAFAWDLEANTRSASVFIVPHKRDTRDGVKDLTDLRDVYENNANNGARRLREAIFSVLPAWFTAQAIAICEKTLEGGGGKPLAQRIAEAVKAFERHGVTPARMETKFGRPVAEWTGHDVALLGTIYESIKQGTVTADQEFPAERVTAAEITGNGHDPSGPAPTGPPAGQEPAAGPEAPRRPQPAGKQAVGKLTSLLKALQLGTDEDVAALLEWQCGEPYAGTRSQVQLVTSYLEDHLKAAQGDTVIAAGEIWTQYRTVTGQDAAAEATQ